MKALSRFAKSNVVLALATMVSVPALAWDSRYAGCGSLYSDDMKYGVGIHILPIDAPRDAPGGTIDEVRSVSLVTCGKAGCKRSDLGEPGPLALSWEGEILVVYSDADATKELGRAFAEYFAVEIRPFNSVPNGEEPVLHFDPAQCFYRPPVRMLRDDD